MFYVYRLDIGNWVISCYGGSRQDVELHWHARDGTSERAGVYRAVEHAIGAVHDQVTGLDCWDLLSKIPSHIRDPDSWEQLEHYP